MDLFDRVGKGVGDLAGKARERERVRLEDGIQLIETLDAAARTFVRLYKQRPGYMWDQEAEECRLRMLSTAAAINDPETDVLVDGLAAVPLPGEGGDVDPRLDEGYRALVKRLGAVRRELLADD